MQEFSSISVSTYNPDELVGQLNDQVKTGWSVVAIVPTGSTVTAYLSRDSAGTDADADETEASETFETDDAIAAAAATATIAPLADEPASDHFVVAAATTPEPAPAASEPTLPNVDPTPEPEPAAEPAAAAAPAGWYADPSSRRGSALG